MTPTCHHVVQFYDDEECLVASIADFVADGIEDHTRSLVIATQAHLQAVEDALCRRGISLADARRRGEVSVQNALEVLAKFMVNGLPDRDRTVATLAPLLGEGFLARPLRAFGELVAILWAADNSAAALALEAIWNELITRRRCEVMCAYPMARFRRESSRGAYSQICRHHGRVIPAVERSQVA